jgi:hypothetical protein
LFEKQKLASEIFFLSRKVFKKKMSDCVLTRTSNVCQLWTCVKTLEGLESTSASPTDIWIINFKPNTTYYGKELDSAYLKISVNPNYIESEANQGLEYERRVYREVTDELVERRVCPNFLRGLLVGDMCNFDDLLRVVKAGISPELIPEHEAPDLLNGVLPEAPDDLRDQLVENLAWLVEKPKAKSSASLKQSGTVRRRPALTNFAVGRPDPPALVRDEDAVKNIEQNLRYGCLLTERLVDVVSLSDWLVKDTKFKFEDFLAVVFQLIVTLWVMDLRKMVHYDLHTGNVLIEKIRPKRYGYVLNGKEYKVNTIYLVRVFDFDRSYVVNLGCNKWHVESECQFVPNLDLARLLCDMFGDLKISQHPQAPKLMRTLEEIFGVQQQTITPNVCAVVNADMVQKKVPNASGVPQDLLTDCLPRLVKRMEPANGQADTYIIDERMFRPNGALRSEEEYNLLSERKQGEMASHNEDWEQLTDNVYQLQASVRQLSQNMERSHAEALRLGESAKTWSTAGTATSSLAAAAALGTLYKTLKE